MFLKLQVVRDKLAAIPSSAVDAATRKEIVQAIDELDDAMVADTRLQVYMRSLPPITDGTNELLAMFAGTATTAEICS